ncbi:hypothetical protein A6A08_04770 [Nocardiopsis sp. TSRI0078]|uniref:hypothetical protein n=1 Tax=unclassified Nocardiopsis TaxID=2649073 RepID=UPI00093E1D2B|nr:hypothetical protein [Nocardiopsis sp. TSRI0078]OKI18931.1 hypothetical protein A6A08_04770 [Nocardiopsis sp. TSRI0078]
MTSVNSLVDIAVFGIVGAIMMAALIGLLLVLPGGASGTTPKGRVAFGTASVVLLVALPTLAAADSLSAGAGFWTAFAVASCAVAVVYAVNVGMLPLVARRRAAAGGRSALASLRPSLPVLAVGLLVCLALGLLGASVSALIV